MTLNFEKYAARGNEIVHRLDLVLGSKGTDHAARVLRSVLHALRNRFSMEESFQFMAQLPMALKSVYVEGWKPEKLNKSIRSLEDLADEVMKEDGRTVWRDFSSQQEAAHAIRLVMGVLTEFISPGELQDIAATVPEDLRNEILSWGKAKAPITG
ncbi:MAG: DUF2267 domain-containing protein [Bacteroidetes bacterium]|nr:DUF2267 domain-containing protein [Bacteroidota bacterium]